MQDLRPRGKIYRCVRRSSAGDLALSPPPTHIIVPPARALLRFASAVPGGPNRPNRGAIPPVPPGPMHAPNLTPPTVEGLTVREFQQVHACVRA